MLSDKQIGVLKGMATGLATSIAVLCLAVFTAPQALLPAAQDALKFSLTWDTLVIGCLAFNIALLARHRFFAPEDIDGGGLSVGSATARTLQATLQNTLEQTVLAISVHLICPPPPPQGWQAAVPAAASLFVIGRILFWRGYAAGAPARALGFALTFYPSVAMLLTIIGRLLLR